MEMPGTSAFEQLKQNVTGAVSSTPPPPLCSERNATPPYLRFNDFHPDPCIFKRVLTAVEFLP